jgi:two-component sensor histidine kinase
MGARTLTAREARQKLDETRHRNVPFEEKARRALELGRQYLGTDNAHLAQIDPKTGHWEATVSTDPQDGRFPPGVELDLETTYCRQTIATDGPVSLHDAPAQGWDDDPAPDVHGFSCYHGTTLYLDEEPYGTLCFVANDPRDEPFKKDERLFADLVRRLLERELEKQRYQTKLARRTNLVNVLNRVLRHNIRNDMSVIRGRTRILADQLDDSTSATAVLEKIDSLIELCEKARDAEEIVDQNHDRTQTHLGALVRGVVTDVRAEFPAASVRLDAETDITAQVLPSLKRAVRELVENAAKHGGVSPSVTVTVEHGPETLSFEITVQPRDSEPVICRDNIGALPYDGDSFNGSVGTLRDVTDQKRRERELTALKERYETFIEAAPNPVFVADYETGEIVKYLGVKPRGFTVLGPHCTRRRI